MASSWTSWWWLIVVGMILMFLAVVFDPSVFQQTCCKSAKNLGNQSCTPCGSGWNGQCSPQIEAACCDYAPTFNVRMCDGRLVSNPFECYELYCQAEDSICKPIEQLAGGFKCECTATPGDYT